MRWRRHLLTRVGIGVMAQRIGFGFGDAVGFEEVGDAVTGFVAPTTPPASHVTFFGPDVETVGATAEGARAAVFGAGGGDFGQGGVLLN